MSDGIKNKVVSGLFWSYGERILAQAVSFIVSIILARVLDPTHYGVVAIVTIFITIFNVFVSSGLGSALIQKKDADALDFSTIFHSGIVISVALYAILFLFAPVIASAYRMPELTSLLRVLGLRLPITSVNTVQHAYVSKHLIFKKFFFATLFGTMVSAVIGITMAYSGFGAWALIFQYLSNTIIDSLVLFVILPWKPQAVFSWERFKTLFSYGWKILVSDLIQTVYNDVRGLAIGAKYSSADLAYYNRGQTFTDIVVVNVETSMKKVLFPVMSEYQRDLESVKRLTRTSIKTCSYIMSPLLIGLIAMSEPMILALLTEKWLPAVPYLQALCIANLFQPMHVANLQAIKALGRSDISLKLEIIKKSYSIIILILTIVLFDDPFVIAIGFVLSTFMSVFVNAIPNRKLLKYGYKEQLGDLLPNLLMALVMGIAVYALNFLEINVVIKLVIQIILGGVVYIALSLLTKNESYSFVKGILKDIIHHKTGNRKGNPKNG